MIEPATSSMEVRWSQHGENEKKTIYLKESNKVNKIFESKTLKIDSYMFLMYGTIFFL